MGMPDQIDLVRHWDCDGAKPAFRRLERLLACGGAGDALCADTPGGRNRRYLVLHRELVGLTMEAQAQCPKCATLCEFPLPLDAMLASPVPAPREEAEIRHAGRTYRFRMPTMADVAALGSWASGAEMGRAVAEMCRVGGAEEELPDGAIERLSDALDAADPLANPAFGVGCAECGLGFSASIDLASFVAREFDRLVDRLLREVHQLARAYGWSEAEILAIPPARRARYLALVARSARSARPVAV